MATARGRISAVQEGRFRLLTDGGQGLLLTLGHDASIDDAELEALHAGDAHVVVEYDGEPNLASGVARRIRRG
jgi:hypothetical protein